MPKNLIKTRSRKSRRGIFRGQTRFNRRPVRTIVTGNEKKTTILQTKTRLRPGFDITGGAFANLIANPLSCKADDRIYRVNITLPVFQNDNNSLLACNTITQLEFGGSISNFELDLCVAIDTYGSIEAILNNQLQRSDEEREQLELIIQRLLFIAGILESASNGNQESQELANALNLNPDTTIEALNTKLGIFPDIQGDTRVAIEDLYYFLEQDLREIRFEDLINFMTTRLEETTNSVQNIQQRISSLEANATLSALDYTLLLLYVPNSRLDTFLNSINTNNGETLYAPESNVIISHTGCIQRYFFNEDERPQYGFDKVRIKTSRTYNLIDTNSLVLVMITDLFDASITMKGSLKFQLCQ